LRDCMELEGYIVEEAATAAETIERLEKSSMDLITLDLNLGGKNGLILAQEIRGRCNVPIVMISGKGDTIDRVVGLELGADDYISKPFHVREVLARIRAVLRRYGGAEHAAPTVPLPNESSDETANERYQFEGFVLNVPRRELRTSGGELCDLTTAEFDMLTMFVQRPARVLSRDNIMDLLKGSDWSPLDRSIDNLIVRLRRKIEPTPSSPRLIKTVRGVGYVFASAVEKG
ncbi:MAG: winged helix-turn-helix domain-containing protein, partial [Hyphomicrobiaceae bacterium]